MNSCYFDHLPANVLMLSGYDFFQFIRNTLGEPEAQLLSKISVKTTLSFMLIEDPLHVFNQDIDDSEIDALKEKLCFKMKNDKYLIKPGVLSGFAALKEALKEKSSQQTRRSTKRKQQQEPIDVRVSPISSLSLQTQEENVSSLSLSDHKLHIIKLIKNWCNENRENLNLEHFELEEDIDFTLNINFNQQSLVQATIKCKCGKIISLGRNDQKVQVSNYYKHLQSFGCSHMRDMKKTERKVSIQHQPQSTNSWSEPAAALCASSVRHLADECLNVQSTFDTNATATSQAAQNSKRRITSESQSQSRFSTKRKRS